MSAPYNLMTKLINYLIQLVQISFGRFSPLSKTFPKLGFFLQIIFLRKQNTLPLRVTDRSRNLIISVLLDTRSK